MAYHLNHDLPRIFVVGTGRSGTWLLYQILGGHPDVHTFPSEMRFLIDPGGLMDLLDALTFRYSPVKAREALYRFERFLGADLATPGCAPYAGFDFPAWLGGSDYWEKLEGFCDALVDGVFEGSAWQVEPEANGRLVRLASQAQALYRRAGRRAEETALRSEAFTRARRHLKQVKYFSDRGELARLAAGFVDDLFLSAARSQGKRTWSEKTPQHLLHLDFLYELFPTAAVIHIQRDPRGVVQSLTRQRWAPKTLEGASLFARDVYRRWFDLRAKLPLGDRCYLEVRLEDLAADPGQELARIAAACSLEGSFRELPEIHQDKVNYWQKSMQADEIELVNRLLGPEISGMGYEL